MPASATPNLLPPDPRYRIEVTDHTGTAVGLDRIEAAIAATLRAHSIARAVVEVSLVDDATIRQVNRTHLQHDWPTDVISFPGDDPLDPAETKPAEPGSVFGELIISVDTARQVAAELEVEPLAELVLYAIHGTLHLVGLDDGDEESAAKMRIAERKIMETAGFVWRESEGGI